MLIEEFGKDYGNYFSVLLGADTLQTTPFQSPNRAQNGMMASK